MEIFPLRQTILDPCLKLLTEAVFACLHSRAKAHSSPCEDFASPRMHEVTPPLILCLGVRLPEEGWGMTQQLPARSASPFNRIFCSSGAAPSLAGAHMPDLEAQLCSRCKGSTACPRHHGLADLAMGRRASGNNKLSHVTFTCPTRRKGQRAGNAGDLWDKFGESYLSC